MVLLPGLHGWHAVFGTFDTLARAYHAVAHYHSVTGVPGPDRTPIDSTLAWRLGGALAASLARLPRDAAQGRVIYNTFARVLDDSVVEVWFLPAWQPSGWLLYGREYYFRFAARDLSLRDSLYVAAQLRGYRPDSTATIRLQDHNPRVPSIGGIFFLLAYGHLFKRIYVETQRYRTTFWRDPEHPAWMIVVRQDPDTLAH